MKSVMLCDQETTINIYRDEDTAEVYTCDTTMMTKLDRRCKEYPDVYRLVRQDEYGKWYELPKSRISFRGPARVVSDEERQKIRERFERTGGFGRITGKGDTL